MLYIILTLEIRMSFPTPNFYGYFSRCDAVNGDFFSPNALANFGNVPNLMYTSGKNGLEDRVVGLFCFHFAPNLLVYFR